jgi:hypothetical protein
MPILTVFPQSETLAHDSLSLTLRFSAVNAQRAGAETV